MIVLESYPEYRGPRVVVEKIIQAFSEKMIIGDQAISLGVSVGVSLYPQDGRDEDTLIKHADAAMYQAKQQGLSFFFYQSLSSGNGKKGNALDQEMLPDAAPPGSSRE